MPDVGVILQKKDDVHALTELEFEIRALSIKVLIRGPGCRVQWYGDERSLDWLLDEFDKIRRARRTVQETQHG